MNTLKTLLYMGFMHGLFTFYIPYQLALMDTRFIHFGIFSFLGIPLWLMGTLILIWCSVDMIHKGRGTPAHLAPPKALIVNGLYRHIRNPIYLGALTVVWGSILWSGSQYLILYFLFFFLGFHFLIVFIEEPILKNTFGAEYEEYCRNVPRWIPRIQ